MEADVKEPTGVTRGQNAVQVMPLDWSGAGHELATLVDRIDPARAETQLLIVTADAENAAAAAQAIVSVIGERPVGVIAATASPRASRLLRNAPAHVVAGAPAELVALLQGSALKPENVRGVVFAWLDPILETPDAAPLETLLGELPKDGARLVLAAELTPAYEALIERYARRARRATESASDEGESPLVAEYVSTSHTHRRCTERSAHRCARARLLRRRHSALERRKRHSEQRPARATRAADLTRGDARPGRRRGAEAVRPRAAVAARKPSRAAGWRHRNASRPHRSRGARTRQGRRAPCVPA